MSTTTIPETAAERTARHLGQCQRLAELAMMLAEAAAARAAMAFSRHPPGPEQAGDPSARPPHAPHPASLFTHLSNAVRAAIRLEARIVAGHAAASSRPTGADPRRARIRRAIRQATVGRFARAEIHRDADRMLAAELAMDPDGTTSLPDLLAPLCDDLRLELDYEKLAADLATQAPAPAPGAPLATLQPEPSHINRPPIPPH